MIKISSILKFSGVVSVCLFAISAQSQYDKRTEQLKGNFRKGFITTCMPTITSQIERSGLSGYISVTQKIKYCTCVAIKIFDDMTELEIDHMMGGGELPNRKKLARPKYSEQCTDSELI
jgi:hypothetical protein